MSEEKEASRQAEAGQAPAGRFAEGGMMTIPNSLALGYIIGALWSFAGGLIFVMYQWWKYKRTLDGIEKRTRELLKRNGVLD